VAGDSAAMGLISHHRAGAAKCQTCALSRRLGDALEDVLSQSEKLTELVSPQASDQLSASTASSTSCGEELRSDVRSFPAGTCRPTASAQLWPNAVSEKVLVT
jgi:hypothetical protein